MYHFKYIYWKFWTSTIEGVELKCYMCIQTISRRLSKQKLSYLQVTLFGSGPKQKLNFTKKHKPSKYPKLHIG